VVFWALGWLVERTESRRRRGWGFSGVKLVGELGIVAFFGVYWRVVLLRWLVLVMMDDTCYIRELRVMGIYIVPLRHVCCHETGELLLLVCRMVHASMIDACLGMFRLNKSDLEHAYASPLRLVTSLY
jgi:hypothetical protein